MEHEGGGHTDDDDEDDMESKCYQHQACDGKSNVPSFFPVGILPKRESSRRKAKENSSSKRAMQDKILQEEDENAIPGLDLSDSDDDATWTPKIPGDGGAVSR